MSTAKTDVNLESHGSEPRCVRKFLPAIFLYPMWLYVVTKRGAWSDLGDYWVMSLTMVLGSLIAGSTPVGGGVVAFPVLVLHFKMEPQQGRDFSLMIQAVGMSAASFLILTSKRHLCHFWLILWTLSGTLCGMLLGFELHIGGKSISLIYTTTVSCFAIAYFYHREFKPEEQMARVVEPWDLKGRFKPWLLLALACVFGFIGGILTSKVGSGADMMAYIYGILYNSMVEKDFLMKENMITVSSVIIMAACSVMACLLRLLTAVISKEVFFCWAAAAPVVVLGAPLGSLFLMPEHTKHLRRCFYVLVLVQLVSMCALQLRGDDLAWTLVFGALFITTLISHVLFRWKT